MSVKKFVDTAIADNKIAFFSKSWCPYCKKAKTLLEDEFPDVKPTIYELDEMENGSAIQQYLLEKSGQRTVPNIYVNSEHIGGSDDLKTSLKQGKLAKLISA